jgi:ATP-dependent Clp protease ATP-binding subunit ClpA
VPCRAALQEALQEALRDRAGLEPEHVLLALLGQEGCGAVRVLAELGLEPAAVRASLEPALA